MHAARRQRVVAHAPPRPFAQAANMGGIKSHGMLLCASNDDHTAVEVIDAPAGAKRGERITVEGFEGEPMKPNPLQKKKASCQHASMPACQHVQCADAMSGAIASACLSGVP